MASVRTMVSAARMASARTTGSAARMASVRITGSAAGMASARITANAARMGDRPNNGERHARMAAPGTTATPSVWRSPE